MQADTGEIRDLDSGPQKQGEILITEMERKYLEMFQPADRKEVLDQIRSKNNNARRRAKKKIAKASRQRNRR